MFKKGLIVAEQVTKNLRRLVNDAGVRNGVNDAFQVMCLGVPQRECEASERFATACRHCEPEKSRRQDGSMHAILVNLVAYGIEPVAFGVRKRLLVFRFKGVP